MQPEFDFFSTVFQILKCQNTECSVIPKIENAFGDSHLNAYFAVIVHKPRPVFFQSYYYHYFKFLGSFDRTVFSLRVLTGRFKNSYTPKSLNINNLT